MKYYRFKNKKTLLLIKFIDSVALIFDKIFPQRDIDMAKVKKILIIRLDHIGDCILTTPAIRYLRKKTPQSHISILVNPISAEIIKNDPDINEIIIFDAFWFKRPKVNTIGAIKDTYKLIKKLREEKFDLAVDFRGDIRNIFLVFLSAVKFRIGYEIGGGGFLLSKKVKYFKNIHEVEKNINIVKSLFPDDLSEVNLEPVLYVTKEDEYPVDKILKKNQIKNDDFLIGIHPGAGTKAKLWDEKKWAEVADRIIELYNAKVIITGNCEEKDMLQRISEHMKAKPVIVSDLTLGELSALIKQYRLLISVDSAPIHIAYSLKVPVVAIMSATNKASEWGPRPTQTKNIVIQKDVPCKCCELEECYNHICMSLITSNEVLEKVQNFVR